jgi:predicted PurR-regulated permease PerM
MKSPNIITAVKVTLGVLITILVIFFIFELVQQNKNSQRAVTSHTQTLQQIQALDEEIKTAVSELKASNTADHSQTVKYINCVLVGITNSPTPSQALTVYQTCLVSAGVTPNGQ